MTIASLLDTTNALILAQSIALINTLLENPWLVIVGVPALFLSHHFLSTPTEEQRQRVAELDQQILDFLRQSSPSGTNTEAVVKELCRQTCYRKEVSLVKERINKLVKQGKLTRSWRGPRQEVLTYSI